MNALRPAVKATDLRAGLPMREQRAPTSGVNALIKQLASTPDTEEEWREAVARLEEQGQITAEEVRALEAAIEAGEIDAEDLPLPEDAVSMDLGERLMLASIINALLGENLTENREPMAVLAVRLRIGAADQYTRSYQEEVSEALLREHAPQRSVSGLTAATEETARQARGGVRPILEGLPPQRRQRFASEMRGIFEDEVDRRVRAYTSGRRNLRQLHTALREMVRDDLMRFPAIGSGQPLSVPQLNRIGATWREEQTFLQRFMRQIAAKEAAGNPMSTAQIAARAKQYAGSAWSGYWRAESGRYGPGWIVRYDARDDENTCGPCAEAAAGSPYAAGTDHSVPASECRGGRLCRCRLSFTFDPDLYSSLA